jgi:hypothetical protein
MCPSHLQKKLLEQDVYTTYRLYNGMIVERNQTFADMVAEHMAAGMFVGQRLLIV